MTLSIHHAGLTDVGRVRSENQDCWFADPGQGLYVVADGMGGGIGGGLAARIVVETLPRLLQRRMAGVDNLAGPGAVEEVLATLVKLSDRLSRESRDQFGAAGVGSTVVFVLILDRVALVANMGDSRAYLLRNGRLEQLTTDHTIIHLLIESGDLQPEEAADHPARGQLTRFVGMPGEALPESGLLELRPNDRLLLCTDGLTGLVNNQRISAILNEQETPEHACRQLITAANNAGGQDNITAVVLAASQE